MRFKNSLVIAVGATLGCVVLSFYWNVASSTIRAAAPKAPAAPPAVARLEQPTVTFVDPAIGPRDAKLVIIEFGDYLCPYCKSAQAAVERLLADRPGEVRFVWKHMPSPLHPGADVAARASLCADRQGKFWEFHHSLFDDSSGLDGAGLSLRAGELGLDTDAFNQCLSSQETQPLVERTVSEGQGLGLTVLPTFYVNGKRYDGELTYDELTAALGSTP